MSRFSVRWCILPLLACVPGLGCAMMGRNAETNGVAHGQQEPKMEEESDRWGFVGKEGRGSRALEDENDPLKPWLMSKPARDIERSLGYKVD